MASDPELEMLRGRQAATLLDNELLKEALDTIEQQVEDRWKATAFDQTQQREELWHMGSAVRLFRGVLQKFIQTGKMAAITESQRQDELTRGAALEEWDGSPDTRRSSAEHH
jgi:hypothetical protein